MASTTEIFSKRTALEGGMTSIHPKPVTVVSVTDKDILSVAEEGISSNELTMARDKFHQEVREALERNLSHNG